MKNFNNFKRLLQLTRVKPGLFPIFLSLIFCSTTVSARVFFLTKTPCIVLIKPGAGPEKKVDYMEQIYFSGQNKAGLVAMINATIQEMESKPATQAVARQYVFLTGIKDQAAAAETSCDVEDMLAAGICDIDPIEAAQQNISQPKQHLNLDNILAGVNNLNNNVSGTAGTVYTLTNGAAAKASAGVLSATSAVNNVTATVSQVNEAVKDVKSIVHMFSHDKPCKKVVPKTIEIGDHTVADASIAADK